MVKKTRNLVSLHYLQGSTVETSCAVHFLVVQVLRTASAEQLEGLVHDISPAGVVRSLRIFTAKLG